MNETLGALTLPFPVFNVLHFLFPSAVRSLQKGHNIRLVLQGIVWAENPNPAALHVHLIYISGTINTHTVHTPSEYIWQQKKNSVTLCMYVSKNNQSFTFKIMKKVEEVVFILLKYKHITLRPLNIQIFNIQLVLNWCLYLEMIAPFVLLAGVQWTVEGETCCDQVWDWGSSEDWWVSRLCTATGDELIWQTHSWNLYGWI